MPGHKPDWLVPDWPAPATIRAASTLRLGGESLAPYDSWNLGDHVGDDPVCVAANRARLRSVLGLVREPAWLCQSHGAEVARVGTDRFVAHADASVTTMADIACVVLTADCLPVLFCARDGSRVGVAHAGWRGLAAGVLEQTVQALGGHASELLAWLGPAIGPAAFEVGPEVRSRFLARDPGTGVAFQKHGDRYRADLYEIARRLLRRAGVSAVYGGHWCTSSDPAQFFSYRRDGTCGRMASLVWIAR